MNPKMLIPNDQKIITIKELQKWGYSYYRIGRLVEEGNLIKLDKKNFENAYFNGEDSEFYVVRAYAPTGVVCLSSAASFYGLTTIEQDAINVAVIKKRDVSPLLNEELFNLHSFEKKRYETDIKTVKYGPNYFQIYGVEKTVMDVIHFRKDIGDEEALHVLRNYLKRKDGDLNRLEECAERLNSTRELRMHFDLLMNKSRVRQSYA